MSNKDCVFFIPKLRKTKVLGYYRNKKGHSGCVERALRFSMVNNKKLDKSTLPVCTKKCTRFFSKEDFSKEKAEVLELEVNKVLVEYRDKGCLTLKRMSNRFDKGEILNIVEQIENTEEVFKYEAGGSYPVFKVESVKEGKLITDFVNVMAFINPELTYRYGE